MRERLIDLFSIEGYPDEIVTDNGPPFQSKEFAKYAFKEFKYSVISGSLSRFENNLYRDGTGRNLTTRAQAEIDIKAIRSVLQERQLKMTLDHDSS